MGTGQVVQGWPTLAGVASATMAGFCPQVRQAHAVGCFAGVEALSFLFFALVGFVCLHVGFCANSRTTVHSNVEK